MSSADVANEVRNNAVSLRRHAYSESDTVSHLIDPVLVHLGFPAVNQRRESQLSQNRPDIVIWEDPAQIASGSPATAILEAKSLDTDLNGNGLAREKRPKEQIARYINGYERSSLDTLGILTDGNVWHIVRPVENKRQPRLVKEFRLLDGTLDTAARALDEMAGLLGALDISVPSFQDVLFTPNADARAITNAIASGDNPAAILGMMANASSHSSNLKGQVELQGKAQHAENAYWDAYAYAAAGRVKVEQGDLDHEAVCVAVVRMARAESDTDVGVYRQDVDTIASTFAKSVPVRMSVVIAIQPDEGGNPVNARVAVHYQGHTGMTAEFDPFTPSRLALRSMQRIYDLLRRQVPPAATDVADAVAAKGVRDEFYESLTGGWVLRQYAKAKGGAIERRRYREAILRHLIRALFVWILKEEGKLPQDAFDEAFAEKHAPGDYHKEILTYMFHERLNKPKNQRGRHPIDAIQKALEDTRFLNGSLFARHRYDDALALGDEEYFGADPKRPGLFTILSEYDWTVSEHTPTHSDQTIDPEVLSNLFENLIAATETNDTPDRMPDGAYYTPADVAEEMSKDALMIATRNHAPKSWSESDLLSLFGDADTPLPRLSARQRQRLAKRIEELTVFDPSVGSGVFPLSVVHAIRAALAKLDESDEGGRLTRAIISKQIHAQDINPMAVQVTRLRLFIAMIAAEGNTQSPLLNLEAKIVCADTLSAIPNRLWSPTATGGLQDADPNIVGALEERAAIFSAWQDAHEESDKAELRTKDEAARARLKSAIADGIALPETGAFADHPLLEPDAPPARTDPRLLFYRENWRGFDVVIGNPPYERISYSKRSAAEKKRLRERARDKGYATLGSGDLYTLITEAALTLANPEGGVLTLIVPLSVCFGQRMKSLRQLIERNSGEIRLRNQDNRPQPIFHDSPVAHPESRQRTTILTAVMKGGSGKPRILTTGPNKWLRSQRHTYIKNRAYTALPGQPKADRLAARSSVG